jgi:LuxR family transcriptional regulator, activator of conjugal transfer of Ti plasmids
MKQIEYLFQEFIDSLQTARDDREFEQIATRTSQGLGFRWFAYLRLGEDGPKLISSYPKSWTSRYLHLKYHRLDPVVIRARSEHTLFVWRGTESTVSVRMEQRKFFDEAATFGIRSGITVPVRGGFGRTAAFTLATDDSHMQPERLLATSSDVVQLLGLYFHTHLPERLLAKMGGPISQTRLTPRETQCLAWAARGKTVSDTAVLMSISPRTVTYYLEKARQRLGAASITHCVARAMRLGLLP